MTEDDHLYDQAGDLLWMAQAWATNETEKAWAKLEPTLRKRQEERMLGPCGDDEIEDGEIYP